MVKLRSIELSLPDIKAAREFLTQIWGLELASEGDGKAYLRGFGDDAYLMGLYEAETKKVETITFICSKDEIAAIKEDADNAGFACKETISPDIGAGNGIIVTLPDGERLRFLTDVGKAEIIKGKDIPKCLTHVVINSQNSHATMEALTKIRYFKVSDETRAMYFIRCNQFHHSIAIAKTEYSSLNHIAFEMTDLDAVMRGIGRMRDHKIAPSWGPGRHGPGDNVYAYYISPFGAVIEYSTAVNLLEENHITGTPEQWKWPPNRIDQWGISDKDFAGLKAAEIQFKF